MPKSKLFIVCTSIVLVAAGVSAGVLVYTRPQPTPIYPVFSFDTAKAPGWWSGGNTNPQATADDSYDESVNGPLEKMPVANLSVHHGGPHEATPADNCFVMFFYHSTPLENAEAGYQQYEARDLYGATRERLENTTETIATLEGKKQYEFRRYNIKAPGEETYLSGYAVGYVALSSGYIEIQGTCKTASDLSLLLPILATVQLRSN